MSKFIVGDLVTLSAAGRSNSHNSQVVGHVGIVISNNHRPSFPYQIQWIGKIWNLDKNLLPMKEYELKFAKNGCVK